MRSLRIDSIDGVLIAYLDSFKALQAYDSSAFVETLLLSFISSGRKPSGASEQSDVRTDCQVDSMASAISLKNGTKASREGVETPSVLIVERRTYL